MLTLTLNDAYYDPAKSSLGTIPPGTPIYVQVDSANVMTTYGAVLENHEINGTAYNNITGPISSTVSLESGVLAPVRPRALDK